MRIVVAAVGRLKQGSETELSERYRKRAVQTGRQLGLRNVEIIEIRESRAADAGKRMLEESIALANLIPQGAVVVLLDFQRRQSRQRRFCEPACQMAGQRPTDNRFFDRRCRRARRQLARKSGIAAVIWHGYLASSAGKGDAARAALSGNDNSDRTPLSPGMKSSGGLHCTPIWSQSA